MFKDKSESEGRNKKGSCLEGFLKYVPIKSRYVLSWGKEAKLYSTSCSGEYNILQTAFFNRHIEFFSFDLQFNYAIWENIGRLGAL